MNLNILINGVREAAVPLTGSPRDSDASLELVGDAHFVRLGEATHRTHEWEAGEVEKTFPTGL